MKSRRALVRACFVAALWVVLPTLVQAQFTCTTNNGSITITGYAGPGGAVSIPNTINGLPVIGIGDQAFFDCTSLTSVITGTNVAYIGFESFAACSSLTNIMMYANVASIGEYAFIECSGLTGITLPNSVTNIMEGAFYLCSSLTNITVDAPDSFYSSMDGILFDKGQTTVISCPEGISGSYTIPNSVTNIGLAAFWNCSGLTSVMIPNSVVSIGERAFDAAALTNVTIGANVTSIGQEAFEYCSSLASVTIPGSVTSIGDYAFTSCGLTNVTIPDSVTSIGQEAFEGCSSEAGAVISSSVTNIGDNAFIECPSLTTITVDPLNSFYSSADGVLLDKGQTSLIECPGGMAGSYAIPASVTNIGSYAFFDCNNLISVTIHARVTSFNDYVFSDCTNLLAVYFQGDAPIDYFPTSPPVFMSDPNATLYYLQGTAGWETTFDLLPTVQWNPQVLAQLIYITNNGAITITAYTGNSSAVVIPSTIFGFPITSIGTNVFFNCTNLTGVTLPNTVTNLENSAFAGCTALTSVVVPGGAVGSGAFSNCVALTNAILADNITSIADSEFSDCSALTTIIIPGGVTNIGDFAFSDCYSLSGVYFLGDAPVADATVFAGDNYVTNYYLPTTSGWGATFADTPTVPVLFTIVTNSGAIMITKYIGIGGSVVVPGTINGLPMTTIASGAFFGCASLTNITIGSNVVNTATGQAFVGCPNLQAIFVDALNPVYSSVAGVLFNQKVLIFCPNGITGDYTIPNGVAKIGTYAFEYCSGLTSVTFPGSVTSIGSLAFNGCSSLMSYYFLGNAPNAGFEALGVAGPNSTIYYKLGTTGWNQQAQISRAGVGMQTNGFGFNITGTSNLVTVVETCTNLANRAWSPLSTNTLSGNSFHFSDSSWTNYPSRFYLVQGYLTFIGIPEVLWNAQVQNDASFGVLKNQFGFNITGTTNIPIVVEANSDLTQPSWTPLLTCVLTNGLVYFSDPQWMSYASRFYRISSP